MKRLAFSLLLLTTPLAAFGQSKQYQADWQSLDQRPVPQWFDDAKFGIFIHWGVYSVPAYADPNSKIGDSYAEWYWNHMQDKNGPTWKFHLAHYGANFQYQDFAGQFKAEMFDPDQWADLFVKSGARYVVLTSKHHEGFCLWPCPASWNWNSVDVGPNRDLVGDLSRAVVAHGLKMGFYYSLYEWYDPLYHSDLPKYVSDHMIPQMKDLVERYHPSILYTDGEWEHPSSDWHSLDFLAWLFNESSVRESVAVNDRWGNDTRSKHGGFYTSEYQILEGKPMGPTHKWEEIQGIGKSFGYNRAENDADYKSAEQLLDLLVDSVSRGGNFLLDIGPTADGRVPVIMQERLLQLGAWLNLNGEAIYGTHSWRQASEPGVHYTAKGDAVYAIVAIWPDHDLQLSAPRATGKTAVTLLGDTTPLKWHSEGGRISIAIPPIPASCLALTPGYVFKLTAVE
jgi:alpha-L-fucosidase